MAIAREAYSSYFTDGGAFSTTATETVAILYAISSTAITINSVSNGGTATKLASQFLNGDSVYYEVWKVVLTASGSHTVDFSAATLAARAVIYTGADDVTTVGEVQQSADGTSLTLTSVPANSWVWAVWAGAISAFNLDTGPISLVSGEFGDSGGTVSGDQTQTWTGAADNVEIFLSILIAAAATTTSSSTTSSSTTTSSSSTSTSTTSSSTTT